MRRCCGCARWCTELGRDRFFKGRLEGVLEQFVERAIINLELPARIPDADIRKVVAAYGLPPPDAEAMKLLRTLRMNRLCKLSLLAAALAKKYKTSPTWEHFKAAFGAVNKQLLREETE